MQPRDESRFRTYFRVPLGLLLFVLVWPFELVTRPRNRRRLAVLLSQKTGLLGAVECRAGWWELRCRQGPSLRLDPTAVRWARCTCFAEISPFANTEETWVLELELRGGTRAVLVDGTSACARGLRALTAELRARRRAKTPRWRDASRFHEADSFVGTVWLFVLVVALLGWIFFGK
jgi:hypothetical protein